MKNILITGGAGFIGSKLSKFLLEKQYKVTILDDLSTGLRSNIDPNCNFIKACIISKDSVQEALQSTDCCVHLAAIPSVQASFEDWSRCNKVNLHGSINVFEIASKLDVPVVYASSAAVYGNNKLLPLPEATSSPTSPYGLDKLTCEKQACFFTKYKNLRSIGLRLFNVYGEGQNKDSSYSGVISIFMRSIINNQPISIHGDGSKERDFIYVGDVVNAIYKSMKSINNTNLCRIYNVCTGKKTSVIELANTIYKIIGAKKQIITSKLRAGDIQSSVGNTELAKQELGFEAKYDIEEGLKLLYKSLVNS
jgi:UDP-glucose 4-epimerase